MKVPGFHGMRIRDVARHTYQQFEEDDVLTYAASLAFHGLLALFPFLVFLLALVTFLDVPQLLERTLEWSSRVMPQGGMEQINAVVRDFQEGGKTGLLSLGAAGAVAAASGGVRSAINALNQAYDVTEKRPAWKRFVLSVVYTFGLTLLLLTGIGLMLLGPRAIAWIGERTGTSGIMTASWIWLRYPLAVGLLILATGIAYSLLPNVKGFRWVTPGAVLAVILWIALSFGFKLYVENFGRYNVLYGSLGAVIVLLLYLWLSALALLLGGEVNAVIEHEGAERKHARKPDARSAG